MSMRVEFWWLLERMSGSIWRCLCPQGKASYWLDWLPAWAYRQRKNAEYSNRRKDPK